MTSLTRLHRLSERVGPDYFKLDKEEIMKRIEELSIGDNALLERTWKHMTPGRPVSKDETRIRVMQFNMLAEGLSSSPAKVPPFENPTSVNDFGGFDQLPNPEVALDFEVRRFRLLEEILRFLPDVVALEECDHFHQFFFPALQLYGYDGVFQPKLRSPCIAFGYFSDGVALFWKKNKLAPLSTFCGDTIGDDVEVAHVVVTFCVLDGEAGVAHCEVGDALVVAATHLKAKALMENERIRERQLDALVNKVDIIAKESNTNKVIIMGDFNCDAKPNGRHEILAFPMLTKKYPRMKSAYPLENVTINPDDGPENWVWTTWKKRGPKESKHTIDYILTREGAFDCEKLLLMPTPQRIGAHRLPSLQYPSDHISIAADFIILPVTASSNAT
eukprot:GHVN01107089.1.p1 GENE.GHVN01107089.1~~GHVN01107089.1.p1  ORF type:complete len:388 (+),score=53.21 GHVN01107089.1:178-1341(+)